MKQTEPTELTAERENCECKDRPQRLPLAVDANGELVFVCPLCGKAIDLEGTTEA